MAGKNLEQINYKMIFINAAISASATALVLGIINKVFKDEKSGLGAPMKFFANLPLERQAHFADIVTISNIGNKDWLQNQLEGIDPSDPGTFKNFNKTSAGNCAFVALHAEDPEVRSKCLNILKHLKMYV